MNITRLSHDRRLPTADCRLLLGVLMILLMIGQAHAQVRPDVAGNNLPEPPVTPEQLGASQSAPLQMSVQELLAQAGPPPHDPLSPTREDALAFSEFARQVDLEPATMWAVFHEGRPKILETLALERLNAVYGKKRYLNPATKEKHSALLTYLDLVIRRPAYADKPLIHVEVVPLRRQILSWMKPEVQEHWMHVGRITPRMLSHPAVQPILNGTDADLRQAKAVGQVHQAIFNLEHLGTELKLISPVPGDNHWAHITAPGQPRLASTDPRVVRAVDAQPVNPQIVGQVEAQWQALTTSWRALDAQGVNAAIAQLSDLLPRVHPATYPPQWQRTAEHWYNKTGQFTIAYVFYLVAAVALLVSLGAPRRWLVALGVTFLLLGLGVHTAGMIIRMLLAGREWLPLHNQYESYIAISWFAVLTGTIFAILRRQWVFGLAAAVVGGITVFIAGVMPIPSSEIGKVAGILATSNILKIHVTTVLVSYGLITLGFVLSLVFLAVYVFRGGKTLQLAAAGMGYQYAVSAGHGAPTNATDTPDDAKPNTGPARLLNDLDHAQLVVLQLAFWVLGVGIILGAYWADHAWGRWWAWDPKETWALITWIVYLIVIHVRMGVKNRGLVTACLSVLGFFVMLWCYWGVNLLLAGLHSYA